ncbi:MAG TPA: ATP-binding cassette domain-containing protein [Propionibacteriaceae bacterium]|nr:ATP-binding cassette domain-containing protein [Propionibacteriaceae bacterium]
MISTTKLSRTFQTKKATVEAVKGVDIEVAAGELVAFLGPNGAGKSTTLRMLTTLLPPTSGTATVAGRDVVADPAGVRARIGYIGQGNAAGHSYRVRDELVMQGRFYGMNSSDARSRADALLKSLDLEVMAKRVVNTLSGGQKRRLDIAMGLVHSPRLLFLDEPSTGMDPQNRANLWEHIRRMREEHQTTIVVTTHYLEEADTQAERVLVIDHGEIIADDTAAKLKADLAGDRITVNVAADDLQLAAQVVGELGQDVTVTMDTVQVAVGARVDRGPQMLPVAIERLRAAGVETLAARAQQPTLDDVFLSLTGRSLREEDPAR